MSQYPPVVRAYWETEPNYLIEYDQTCGSRAYCAIYFCSNDIWYPHTEEIFRKRIVEKNFFEWYRCRIRKAYKHIFVRDVFKQWYLSGINAEVCSHDKMAEWLKAETQGYKVITVGSSAGGYAAALFAQRLDADYALCFNAQFSLKDEIAKSSPTCAPLLYYSNGLLANGGGNILNMNSVVPLYYVFSNRSHWDVMQHRNTTGFSNVRCIEFKSAKHGIPFLKVALPRFINRTPAELDAMSRCVHSPLWFTIKCVGLYRTITGFVEQAYRAYKKRR